MLKKNKNKLQETPDKKIIFYKRFSFYLLLIIAAVAVYFTYAYYFTNEGIKPEFLKSFLIEILSTIFSIIVLGYIYQVFLENEVNKTMKQDIVETIQMNDGNLLDAFSNTHKQHFIKENLNSIIGQKYGSLLFDGLIKKYTSTDITYRENYEYNVEINEFNTKLKFKKLDNLHTSDYYSLSQSVIYEKHLVEKKNDIEFKIVLALTENSLDHWLKDNNVFIREIIMFDEIETTLSSLTPEEFSLFLVDFLRLKITFFIKKEDETKVNIDIRDCVCVTFINNIDISAIEISLSKEKIKEFLIMDGQETYYKCKVEFCIPYPKSFKRFHFVLPEPTVKPKFTIRFDKEIKNPDYVSYLTNNTKGFEIEKNDNNLFTVTTNEITYPRSGIVFFWS